MAGIFIPVRELDQQILVVTPIFREHKDHMIRKLFLAGLLVLDFSSTAWSEDKVDFQVSLKPSTAKCTEKRAALDFGSGTTKAVVLKVNVCRKKITGKLYEERVPIALNEALAKSSDNTVPLTVLDEALPKVEEMLAEIKKHNPQQIYAVATSVFREAKNGRVLIRRLNKKTGLDVKIISQEEEAELGFWSALATKGITKPDNLIVWDIGGGSMQMYAKKDGKAEIFEGDLASVSFKNQVLETLQFKKPQEGASPNPLGSDKEAAVQLADNHAELSVPKFFKDNATKSRWIGVGGVIATSVQKQIKPGAKEFTRKQLEGALTVRAPLTDEQIGGDYRTTDVTNLALVLGYMKSLNIKKIETAPASLGQGLIYKKLQETKVAR